STKARAKGLAHIKADTGNIDLNLRNTLLVKDLRTNLISVSKITRNDREILFRKDDAIVRDLNGEVKLVADRVGDLYYLREQAEQVKAVEKESERTSTSDLDLWHARLGHLHMDAEEDPEPGRVLRDRRSCREIVREPSPARARGRPKKQKSGKPGRPRKLYRYVSASSITSSRASSRENLSQEEEEAPEEDDEEASNDVFIPSAVDEVLRTKRPLESSLFQEDKRPRNDRSSSDSEKSPKKDEDNTDEGDEFMDAKFIEELALMA
ncbi:Protein of unknown function, partial [Cotesia congregata]